MSHPLWRCEILELTGQYRNRRMARVKTAGKELAILEAAARVFAGRPFHAVLIDDVAADAGIGKGTIYRYFQTKDDLFFAAVLFGLDCVAAALEKGLASATTTAERLERIAYEILDYFWDRRHLIPMLQHDEGDPSRKSELMKRRAAILRFAQETILVGIERRELRGIDARIGAELFLGMVRAANLFRAEGDRLEDLCREITRVFLQGVRREKR
jgi:AcrR family transcriptional regulator